MASSNVKIVSFSGIDGAGKSTQIQALLNYLRERGFAVKIYTFWDDVVVLSGFRERMTLSVFKGDRGVGSPEKPIVRRDKNVTSWYVIISRLILYLLDVCGLAIAVSRASASEADVVIFDRYVYDELANLPLKRRWVRFYIGLLLRLTPKPDLALLLDADSDAACERKPEYPPEFVERNREAYLRLARLAGMTVLPPLTIEEMKAKILNRVSEVCTLVGSDSPFAGVHCSTVKGAVNGPAS
jgi:thymidylate kinase